MKLTNDIIRDVLLCIEKQCESYTDGNTHRFVSNRIHWKCIYDDEYLNSKYDIDDIKYCIMKLGEAELIDTYSPKAGNSVSYVDITSMTWQGHEFLNTIRDDDLWNSAKKKLGDMTKMSFSILTTLLSEYAIAYGKNKLGLM